MLNEFRVERQAARQAGREADAGQADGGRGDVRSRTGFPVANAIDGNPRDRLGDRRPQFGQDHAAMFQFEKPVERRGRAWRSPSRSTSSSAAANHTIGKFRLSVTTDPNPKLASPLTPEQIAMLDTPDEKRTPTRRRDCGRCTWRRTRSTSGSQAEAAKVPPTDARVLGAQDLVWALINSPAFLFNH